MKLLLLVLDKKDVEVEYEDNLLTVRTKQVKKDDKTNDEIIHQRHFTKRSFARTFTIDDVKVNDCRTKGWF